MASASAGNGVAVTTAPATIYDPAVSAPADQIIIANRAISSGNVLVNCANLHGAGEWAGIAPGNAIPFRAVSVLAKPGGVGVVQVKADSGTATIDFTISR